MGLNRLFRWSSIIAATNIFYFFILFASCKNSTSFRQTDRGVYIYIKNIHQSSPKWIYLEPIDAKVVRVVAGVTNNPQFQHSLMRDTLTPIKVDWQFIQKEGEHILYTSEMGVHVNSTTGATWFSDKNDQPILKEQQNIGKIITSAHLPGDSLYQLTQIFESPENEAIYGLGQPQTGIINFKNEDVNLTQYNSVVAVPFLISSRNYGILWDNYSITRFGDARQPRQLNTLQLTGKNGTSKGLTVTYADRYDSTKIFVQQQEDSISYTYIPDLDRMPLGFPMANGKITWEGFITPDTTGLYKFYLSASGYLRFYLDGQLLLDKWREGWNPGPSHFKQSLTKNQQHALRIEWIPESSQAFVSLQYLPPAAAETHNTMALTSEAGKNIDYYFIAGNNADEVISGYRLLTGKATMLPEWSLGFWQSRERYKTQQEIESTVEEYRKRKIGLDNIVLDWSFWKEDAWGSQQFDSSRFPNATAMVQKLKREHAHFMISVWPKFYEGIPAYNYLNQHGWLFTQNIKNKQRDWIGKGYTSTFYDAFNPLARKAFWQLLDTSLFQKGVEAWWLDASEPDIYSNSSIAHRKKLMEPIATGSSTAYFNGYPLENAKAVYEGQRSAQPDQRVFILTRSGYAGIQRYAAATWSGDIAARFDELQRQIPAGINFSLSGLPYWTSDIGGFFVEDKYDKPFPKGAALEEWRELNTRWFQFGAFCPLFRSHGQFPYREIFNIAPDNHPAYKSMVYYNRLRYRLMPYIYSIAGNTYHHDYTIMRGLAMDFGNDAAVKNIGDQYMFGPALLVNPVYNYQATNRTVYLPAGQGWYDLYSGAYFAGGQTITAAAPYERIPVFVKEGAIVPVGPELQYTREKAADDITLYVYTGKDANFELYEDEGINYNYEKGKYSRIRFTYNEANKSLTISKREGDFEGMLKERVFRVVWITKDKSVPLNFNHQNDTALSYNGNEQTIKTNTNQ